MKRCPFCDFARDPIDGDPDYSHVGALREVAVHIVFQHPGEFQELAETVSGEWDGRFAARQPASPDLRAALVPRYEFVPEDRENYPAEMAPADDGEWVRLDDVRAALGEPHE